MSKTVITHPDSSVTAVVTRSGCGYWPPRGPSLDEPGVLALGAALWQNMPWIPLAD